MDEKPETGRSWRAGLRRRRWLETEIQRWVGARLATAEQGQAILGRYAGEAELRRQWGVRAFVALCGVAAVMFAVGAILLISHNWDNISREVRTGLIFGVMGAAFIGSVISYGMHRAIAGEVLALLGVLLLGAGIWLLAQVYHIEAHYPDGFLWWMIGALATAYLLKSRLCGMAGIILMVIWSGSQTLGFERSNYLCLLFIAAAIVLAYWERSVIVLVLGQLALGCWLMIVAGEAWGMYERSVYLLVLLGAAYFAVGVAEAPNRKMSRAWQVVGVLAVLAGLVGPSFAEFHRVHMHEYDWWHPQPLPVGVAAGVLLVVMGVGYVRGGAAATQGDWPIPLAAAVTAVGLAWWMAHTATGTRHIRWYESGVGGADWWLAIGFNAVMLLVAIWLIVRGVRRDRGLSFFAGVLYVLLLVLMRWVDLIGDMVSSAILFFIAGAVLLMTAYFWRKRERLWGGREVIHG